MSEQSGAVDHDEDITTGGPAVPISTLATSTNTVAAAAGSVAADSDNDSVHGDTASVRSAKRRKKKKAKSKAPLIEAVVAGAAAATAVPSAVDTGASSSGSASATTDDKPKKKKTAKKAAEAEDVLLSSTTKKKKKKSAKKAAEAVVAASVALAVAVSEAQAVVEAGSSSATSENPPASSSVPGLEGGDGEVKKKKKKKKTKKTASEALSPSSTIDTEDTVHSEDLSGEPKTRTKMLTVNVDPESGNAESKKDQPLSPSKRSRASPSTPTHPSSDKIISPKSTSDESSASHSPNSPIDTATTKSPTTTKSSQKSQLPNVQAIDDNNFAKFKKLTVGRSAAKLMTPPGLNSPLLESPQTEKILSLLDPAKRHARDTSTVTSTDYVDSPTSLASTDLEFSLLVPETRQTIMALLSPRHVPVTQADLDDEDDDEDVDAQPVETQALHHEDGADPSSSTSGELKLDDLEETMPLEEEDSVVIRRPVRGRSRGGPQASSRASIVPSREISMMVRSSYCIPHRFGNLSVLSSASMKFFNTKDNLCVHCHQTLKNNLVKCSDCSLVAHRSCSLLLPPTCGIPAELLLAQGPATDAQTFGVSLESQCTRDGSMIPFLVKACIRQIEERGINVEGIYRVNASATSMERLKMLFQHGRPNLDDPEWDDINILANLLKQYFRSLPDPLIQAHLYHDFASAANQPNEALRMACFQDAVSKLNHFHLHTLALTVRHLCRIQKNKEVNKMSVTNLALIFGPNLMRSNNLGQDIMDMTLQAKVLSYLIVNADDLFGADLDTREYSMYTLSRFGGN